jgi:tetratricopeptide (TPR) repeat protein
VENTSEERRTILHKILGQLFGNINLIFKNLGFIPGSDAIKDLKNILEEVIKYPPAISFSKAKKQNIFYRIMDFSNTLRAILINLAIFLLVPFLIYIVYVEFYAGPKRDVVLMNEFEVCQGLQKQGYNGKIIVNKLMNEIIYIRTRAATRMECRDFMYGWLQPTPNIEIPGTGLSLLPFIQYIKVLFGARKTNIGGELSLRNNQVYMTVRVSGKPDNTIKCEMKNLEKALRQQAENIYRCIQPFILAAYFHSVDKKQDSIEVIQRSILHQPPSDDDPWAYNLWGIILFEQKNYDAAKVKFQEAIRLNPKFAIAYNSLGATLLKQRDYEEAIKKFQEAIKIDPKFVPPHINLAAAFVKKEKYELAKTKCQDAIKLDPNDPRPYSKWGDALIGEKKYDQAVAKYQEAIEIDPTFKGAYINYGLALKETHFYKEAIEKYKEAIKIDPKCSVAYNNWGDILEEMRSHTTSGKAGGLIKP